MHPTLAAALLSLALAAPSGAADLYAAGRTLFRLDVASGSVHARTELDSQTTDLAVDPAGRYVAAATSSGLYLHDAGDLTPIAHVVLGVLDAVETTHTGDSLYVLLHPGSNRRRPAGAHRVLVLPAEDLAASRKVATLGSDSYDMFLSPTGGVLVVTRLLGRRVDVIDLPTSRVTTRTITDGGDRNELAVVRALAFTSGTGLLAAESARGRDLILWRFDLGSGEAVARETDWRMHASDVILAGAHVVVNGRDQLARFERASGSPVDRRDLVLDAWHAVASATGHVYLAAPAEDGARVLALDPGGEAVTELAALPARVVRLALGSDPSPPVMR